ncbi:MAG: FliA/WhiG family RNA polymerase sigma factor [Pseudomonadota bacterium]
MIAPQGYREQTPSPERLVEEHMSLVHRLAWHFHGRVGRFVEIDDLIQAGYVGLVEATSRYTVQDGVSFGAYAAIRVRGAILDALRRNSNLCRKTVLMRQTVARARSKLTQRLGREPVQEELAAEVDLTLRELQDWEARFQVNELQSLDEIYTDHSLLFGDLAASPERQTELAELKALLRASIAELPKREALVLQLCYVEELNVYEMGAVLGVTPGRVSQLKKAAIDRLRKSMAARLGEPDT